MATQKIGPNEQRLRDLREKRAAEKAKHAEFKGKLARIKAKTVGKLASLSISKRGGRQ